MGDTLFVILIIVALVAWSVYKSRLQQSLDRDDAGAGGDGDAPDTRPEAGTQEPDMNLQAGRPMPKPQQRKPLHAPSPKAAGKESLKPASGEPEVRLKTPSDARRAFIYSEIFNRKY